MLKLISKIFLITLFLFAIPAQAAEYIKLFQSDIVVKEDGSLDIVEEITVHHEGNLIRRGIYRDLSIAKGESYQIISVMRNNEPEPWFTERKGNYLRLNTGNDDFLPAPATSTFTINYIMYDALRPIKGEDNNELYLNITGKWALPIEKTIATVNYPEETEIVRQYAYQTGKEPLYMTPDTPFEFSYLRPYEEATIAQAFKKGTVNITIPAFWRWTILAFAAMLIYYLTAWYFFGKDPEPRAIVPDWEAPKDLSPLECAYIMKNGKTPTNSLFLHILWLIYQKAVSVREVQKGQFTKAKGFEINTLESADKSNPEVRLFAANYPKYLTVYDSEPDEDLAHYNSKLTKKTEKYLEQKYYRKRNLITLLGSFFVPAVWFFYTPDLCFFLCLNLLLIYFANKNYMSVIIIWINLIPLTLSPAINYFPMSLLILPYICLILVFKYLMFQPTVIGQRQKEKIAGIKMFLETVTGNQIILKDQAIKTDSVALPMENRLTPADMEALFPYAVALGLEKAWESKFKTIFGSKTWQEITSSHIYHTNNFTANFSHCCTKATYIPAPQSSGHGSFGGGFSGGGFGGGGGGGR